MLTLLVPLLFLSTRVLSEHFDTVIGCGGFIRWKEAPSDSKLDFKKLKISLFSETTSTLKDVTDVLPNGAYSVPLYDESVYRIRLNTPKGWYIEPSDGYLLDLRKDPKACSKDFDFSIVGFSIFGQVTTSGMQTGPPGLSVRLNELASHKPVLQNVTQSQGHFIISPVSPGSYSLVISNQDHAEKNHTRASIVVKVLSDSIVLSEPIVLLGHFLRGRVVDFHKNPIVNARVFLLCDKAKATLNTSITPDKLVSSLMVETLGETYHRFFLSQESSTDTNGYFTFDRLPGGSYILVASYSPKKPSAKFTFTPKFYPIIMEHDDVDLGLDTFTLESFKLKPGRVLWSNRTPISSAKIEITGKAQNSVISDSDGFYQLGNLIPGEYTFQVSVKGALFETRSVNFNPLLESLPELNPDMVSVCGSLLPAYMHSNQKLGVYIIVRNIEDNYVSRIEANQENEKFKFCTFLKPGHYLLHPDVSLLKTNQQSPEALRFAPSEIKIDLTGPPIENIAFSQFRAKIFGRLQCLKKCTSYETPIYAQLTSLHSNSIEPKSYEFMPSKDDAREAFFSAEDMLPGDYTVKIVYALDTAIATIDSWCWQKSSSNLFQTVDSSERILRIRSDDLHYNNETTLDFTQTGFLIPVKFELPIYVKTMPSVLLNASYFVTKNNESVENSILWNLTRTCNKICLPSPDQLYTISLSSTCAHFRMLQTTEINPSRDCHLSLNSGPHIRVGAEKLPVFIHLKLDKVAKRFSSDLEEIFNSPYSFQIEDLDLNTNRTLKSELVNTIWPAKPRNVDSLFSSGIFWVKLDNPVRVKSKPFTLQQNNVVHLITHPFSQDVHLQSNSQYHMDNISCALVMPVVETPNHTPTTEVLQSLCFSFFDGQLIEFDLTIAVNLRGRIDPPTEKVDVELYYKVPQTSQQFSPLMQHDHPSLLVDDVSKLEMESKGFNTSVTVATTQTDKHGVFSFRALPLINYEKLNVNSLSEVSKMYQISISKAGYKFDIINSTNTKQMGGFHWYIKSTKLSLVEVFVFKHPVLKDSRQPLPAVLISIIGEGHRANHLTNDDGVVRFVGLSPGQYYLRPMMKEYSFTVISPDPSESGQAIPVQVEEGKSAVVILSARRIAFSASGIVTSLAGIPEFGVLVEATWLPDPPKIIHNDILHLASANNLTCQLQSDQINVIPHEQSLTDSDGNFRIRGLMPGCAYMISVYTSPNAPTDPMYDHLTLDSRNAVSRRVVEHAIPGHVNFKMPSTDTNGFHFYVIRHLFTSTVTVSVQTSDSYLSTLHLVVFPVGHPENTVVKHEFGSDSLLFTLTGSKLAPMIGREYVIRLISDLKSSFYTDVDAQNIVFKPKSGVNEHYTFHFNPKLRNSLSD